MSRNYCRKWPYTFNQLRFEGDSYFSLFRILNLYIETNFKAAFVSFNTTRINQRMHREQLGIGIISKFHLIEFMFQK